MSDVVSVVAQQGADMAVGSIPVPGDSALAGLYHIAELYEDLTQRQKFKEAKKELLKALDQPGVRPALEQREHNNQVIEIQKNEIKAREAGVAMLKEQRAVVIAKWGEDSPGVQKLDKIISDAEAGIAGLKSVNDMLSAQITEINNRPEMKALRPLEAHADLGAEVLKRRGDTAVTVGQVLRFGAAKPLAAAKNAADVIGFVDLVKNGLDSASIASNAVPLVGGAVQAVGGSLQAAVATVSLANNAYQVHKLSKREATAHEVRTSVDDPVLAAAIKRIEMKANRNGLERKVKMARDGALIVTGAASAVAGSALVVSGALALASAPGFGAASAPTLAITGVATGVAIGAGAVSIAGTIGVAAFKAGRHKNSIDAKTACLNAIVGTQELLRIGGGSGKLASDAEGNPVRVRDGALKNEQWKAIHQLQKHAIEKGYLTKEEALDVAKLHDYATTRLISRDTREAVAVLSAKLASECRDAIALRGEGGIVTSDLPTDTPAINAARALGMSDREITSLVNSYADERTRKQSLETLAQKTGLRRGSDTTLTPTTEKVTDAANKGIEKVSDLSNKAKQKIFGSPSTSPMPESQEIELDAESEGVDVNVEFEEDLDQDLDIEIQNDLSDGYEADDEMEVSHTKSIRDSYKAPKASTKQDTPGPTVSTSVKHSH